MDETQNQIPDDILDLPDDQAMEAIAAAGPIADSAQVVVEDHDETQQQPNPDAAAKTDDGTEGTDDDAGEAGGDKSKPDGDGAIDDKPPVKADDKPDPDTKPDDKKPVDDKKPDDDKSKDTPAAPKALSTYTAEEKVKAFDELLGGKLRANGKDIEIRTPEEAKRLMQMGCDYTRKLQKLQPHIRATTMLENNGLLDENKLAFAIDLIKGEPSAIQKLLADTQFDPMSADKDRAADYKPGNHQVSDTEVAFNQALDEVGETSHGIELITEVTKQWDGESKKWLFQNPDLLHTLNQQKSAGIYQQITSEMQRLQALGQIPAGTPFLQAYRAIGDMMEKHGAFKTNVAPVTDQVPVETRIVTPAPAVKNDDKAAAAAPTKAAPAAAERDDTDVLGLSDDEFLKQMKGRL